MARGAAGAADNVARMVTRMSTLFLRTLRDDPAEAELPGHRLLLRAGCVRRVAPGIFTWLPLGLRVFRRVETIVREEMDGIGGQELLFPALLPREPYEASGRWTEYGDGIFRLKDRRGVDHLLGPTHEEMFTLAVKDLFSSYRDLPLVLYQVQTKYRDEARPRAGLLRAREFVMKDSYSFDVDDEGLAAAYDDHRAAYLAAFARLGLEVVVVSAMSGAMGGSRSEEFLCPSPFGEDTYVRSAGGFAANVEAVTTVAPEPIPLDGLSAAHVEDTPQTPTIDSLVAVLEERFPRAGRPWTAADTLKNVVVVLRHPDGSTEPLAVGLPGDREVDTRRLEAALYPATVEAFTEADFAANPGLVKGYIGPGGLGKNSPSGIRYLLDPRVVSGTAWVTGADQPGRHVLDLVMGRDFDGDGVVDAAEVRPGDAAPDGSGPLEAARGIEVGHIFALGRKFAAALGLTVRDASGAQVTVTMGSYGLGITRAVAAIAETHHDERGLIWPRSVAPFDVHLVPAGRGAEVEAATGALVSSLEAAGLSVLLDDRPRASVGVRLADAELIGVPDVVVLGRGLSRGVVEVLDRVTGDREEVAPEDVPRRLLAARTG
jgi:prolyl-tRNA synthetase